MPHACVHLSRTRPESFTTTPRLNAEGAAGGAARRVWRRLLWPHGGIGRVSMAYGMKMSWIDWSRGYKHQASAFVDVR